MIEIVTPRVVPNMPPAPLTSDPPQVFDDKCIAMAAGYPATIGGMNGSATDTNQNALAARERAEQAQTAWSSVSAGVATINAALAAIQAGPVVSINGRSGVVSGLVEKTIVLANNSDLNNVLESGFYRLTATHLNPPAINYLYSQMRVERGGDTIVQEITSCDGIDRAWRGGQNLNGVAVWSDWQRVLGDHSLIERGKYVTTPGSTYVVDPKEASVQVIDVNAPLTLTIVKPRKLGDQLTLMLSFISAQSIVFSSNVKPPSGGIRAGVSGNILTIALVARQDNFWHAYEGGLHPW